MFRLQICPLYIKSSFQTAVCARCFIPRLYNLALDIFPIKGILMNFSFRIQRGMLGDGARHSASVAQLNLP